MPFKHFIASILDSKKPRSSFLEAVQGGVTVDTLIDADCKRVFTYIEDYCKRFSGFPDRFTINGELGVLLPDSGSQPFAYWLDKVKEIQFLQYMKVASRELSDALARGSAEEVHELFRTHSREISTRKLYGAQTVNLFAYSQEVKDDYIAVKEGRIGIPFPWPGLTEETLGLNPEDFCLFVARPAVGKTWVLLNCAHAAWEAKKKVLIVTTEMASKVLTRRFASLHTKIPYQAVRRGQMTSAQEQKFFGFLDNEEMAETRISVVGGNFDYGMDGVAAAVEDAEPDVVFVDGLYLLKLSKVLRMSKTEQVAEIFNELKRVGKRYKLPVVATTQFNREAKDKKQSGGTNALENISLSDAGGWNADLAFSLVKPKDEERLVIQTMKARESIIKPIEIRWDFSEMDFSQVGTYSHDSPDSSDTEAPF